MNNTYSPFYSSNENIMIYKKNSYSRDRMNCSTTNISCDSKGRILIKDASSTSSVSFASEFCKQALQRKKIMKKKKKIQKKVLTFEEMRKHTHTKENESSSDKNEFSRINRKNKTKKKNVCLDTSHHIPMERMVMSPISYEPMEIKNIENHQIFKPTENIVIPEYAIQYPAEMDRMRLPMNMWYPGYPKEENTYLFHDEMNINEPWISPKFRNVEQNLIKESHTMLPTYLYNYNQPIQNNQNCEIHYNPPSIIRNNKVPEYMASSVYNTHHSNLEFQNNDSSKLNYGTTPVYLKEQNTNQIMFRKREDINHSEKELPYFKRTVHKSMQNPASKGKAYYYVKKNNPIHKNENNTTMSKILKFIFPSNNKKEATLKNETKSKRNVIPPSNIENRNTFLTQCTNSFEINGTFPTRGDPIHQNKNHNIWKEATNYYNPQESIKKNPGLVNTALDLNECSLNSVTHEKNNTSKEQHTNHLNRNENLQLIKENINYEKPENNEKERNHLLHGFSLNDKIMRRVDNLERTNEKREDCYSSQERNVPINMVEPVRINYTLQKNDSKKKRTKGEEDKREGSIHGSQKNKLLIHNQIIKKVNNHITENMEKALRNKEYSKQMEEMRTQENDIQFGNAKENTNQESWDEMYLRRRSIYMASMNKHMETNEKNLCQPIEYAQESVFRNIKSRNEKEEINQWNLEYPTYSLRESSNDLLTTESYLLNRQNKKNESNQKIELNKEKRNISTSSHTDEANSDSVEHEKSPLEKRLNKNLKEIDKELKKMISTKEEDSNDEEFPYTPSIFCEPQKNQSNEIDIDIMNTNALKQYLSNEESCRKRNLPAYTHVQGNNYNKDTVLCFCENTNENYTEQKYNREKEQNKETIPFHLFSVPSNENNILTIPKEKEDKKSKREPYHVILNKKTYINGKNETDKNHTVLVSNLKKEDTRRVSENVVKLYPIHEENATTELSRTYEMMNLNSKLYGKVNTCLKRISSFQKNKQTFKELKNQCQIISEQIEKQQKQNSNENKKSNEKPKDKKTKENTCISKNPTIPSVHFKNDEQNPEDICLGSNQKFNESKVHVSNSIYTKPESREFSYEHLFTSEDKKEMEKEYIWEHTSNNQSDFEKTKKKSYSTDPVTNYVMDVPLDQSQMNPNGNLQSSSEGDSRKQSEKASHTYNTERKRTEEEEEIIRKVTHSHQGKKKGLLISLTYQGQLEGTENDISQVCEVLDKVNHFDHLILLNDSHWNYKQYISKEATKKNVLSSLNNLIEQSKDGDILFFYFSGFSIEMKDAKFPHHTNFALLPQDYSEKTYIYSNEIFNIVKKLQGGKQLCIVFDTTYCSFFIPIFTSITYNKNIKSTEICKKKLMTNDIHKKKNALKNFGQIRPRHIEPIYVENLQKPFEFELQYYNDVHEKNINTLSPSIFFFSSDIDDRNDYEIFINGSIKGLLTYCFCKSIELLKCEFSYHDLFIVASNLLINIKKEYQIKYLKFKLSFVSEYSPDDVKFLSHESLQETESEPPLWKSSLKLYDLNKNIQLIHQINKKELMKRVTNQYLTIYIKDVTFNDTKTIETDLKYLVSTFLRNDETHNLSVKRFNSTPQNIVKDKIFFIEYLKIHIPNEKDMKLYVEVFKKKKKNYFVGRCVFELKNYDGEFNLTDEKKNVIGVINLSIKNLS